MSGKDSASVRKGGQARSGRQLFRVFVLVSVIGILIILLGTSLGGWWLIKKNAIRKAEEDAIVWASTVERLEYELIVWLIGSREPDVTGTRDFQTLDRVMHAISPLMHIVKIKVFSTDMRIVYSTDENIIGRVDRDNPELAAALSGRTVSKFERKDEVWDLAEEQRWDVDIVETYIPVRAENGSIIGSFEIYRDITSDLKTAGEKLRQVIVVMMATLVVVFLALGWIMRRSADPIGAWMRKIFSVIPSPFPRDLIEGRSLLAVDLTVGQIAYLANWFVRMRWVACIVTASLTILATKISHFLPAECFLPLAICVVSLILSNVLFIVLARKGWMVHYLLELQICMDLVFLTLMLHFSGGGENPASFAYVFHIIISGILLTRQKCYATVLLASLLFTAMCVAELTGAIEHYTLAVFPHVEHEGEILHGAHKSSFVLPIVICQFVLLYLTAYFTTSIMDRLRIQENRALTERQRLERVVEAAGAGLAVLDRDLRPVWLNEQIRKWLGLTDEMTDESLARLKQWTETNDGAARKTFEDGRVRVVEREIQSPHQRFFQVTVAPLKDRSGEIYQVVELTLDITERKMIEAEMLHSAKMASLGMMTAGIAHEVGNPLASISARLMILEEEHDEAFVKESLLVLKSQTDRIVQIVRSISQFARPEKIQWSSCQIDSLVNETIEMLRFHKLAKRCTIETSFAENLQTMRGAKGQLVQVFLNLGLNALQAMPHGGTLSICTRREGQFVRIEFADTGEGMDKETCARVFDPFFSTKTEGIGLGLCLARQLVDAHGGRITVESELGGGTVFTVILPIRNSTNSTDEE